MQGPIFEEKGAPEMAEQVKHLFLYLDELSSVSGTQLQLGENQLHSAVRPPRSSPPPHTHSKKLKKKGVVESSEEYKVLLKITIYFFLLLFRFSSFSFFLETLGLLAFLYR